MAKKPKDALDIFVADANKDPKAAIYMLLWLQRHRLPELTAVIKEDDLRGFKESMAFMGAKPEVVIMRPQGHPGHPGSPAVGNRRAVPARQPEGPRPFAVVMMVERGTKNAIKPIENSEQGAQERDNADRVRRAKDKAFQFITVVRQQAASGTFSSADINELCSAAETLARAQA